MRIVFATDWWPPRVGGVESQAADLATVLAARGHDVRVLTTTSHPDQLAAGPRVEHVATPMIGDIAAPDLRKVRALADLLEAHRPDVVHAHGMFSTLAIGAVLAARRLSIPSVLTVHSLLRPFPVLVGAAAVFRAFSNRASILTAVSRATASDVVRASGREARPIANGLTLADWASPPRLSNCMRIVAVTRLVRKKRVADLVSAMAFAARHHPSPSVRFEIAGDGSERAGLERLAASLGVGRRIAFHGECSRATVRDLVKNASVFVHSGIHEAFGLAILEARAAGVPVVAMASGGVPELVQHGRHGLLARDRAGLGEALTMMMSDEALRRRCADETARGLEVYDWSQVAARHEDAYGEAIDRRGALHRIDSRLAAVS